MNNLSGLLPIEETGFRLFRAHLRSSVNDLPSSPHEVGICCLNSGLLYPTAQVLHYVEHHCRVSLTEQPQAYGVKTGCIKIYSSYQHQHQANKRTMPALKAQPKKKKSFKKKQQRKVGVRLGPRKRCKRGGREEQTNKNEQRKNEKSVRCTSSKSGEGKISTLKKMPMSIVVGMLKRVHVHCP